MAIRLPDKQYFKISEVSELVGVKPSVLRYWETEFRSARPEKTRTNQRRYERRHVERLLQIKTLVYDQKFSIEVARRRLRDDGAVPDVEAAGRSPAPAVSADASALEMRSLLLQVRGELQDLLRLLGE